MPLAARPAPRKMLPPPTTSATWTPRLTISWTSDARRWIKDGEMPYSPSPISASPLNLSKTRLYAAWRMLSPVPLDRRLRAAHLRHHLIGKVFLLALDAFADLVASETHHFGAGILEQLADRLIRILDERLTNQR